MSERYAASYRSIVDCDAVHNGPDHVIAICTTRRMAVRIADGLNALERQESTPPSADTEHYHQVPGHRTHEGRRKDCSLPPCAPYAADEYEPSVASADVAETHTTRCPDGRPIVHTGPRQGCTRVHRDGPTFHEATDTRGHVVRHPGPRDRCRFTVCRAAVNAAKHTPGQVHDVTSTSGVTETHTGSAEQCREPLCWELDET